MIDQLRESPHKATRLLNIQITQVMLYPKLGQIILWFSLDLVAWAESILSKCAFIFILRFPVCLDY